MKYSILLALPVIAAINAHSGEPLSPSKVDIDDATVKVWEPEDISGVVVVGNHLVLATDEFFVVQALQEKEQGKKYEPGIADGLANDEIRRLANGEKIELDLEGAAADGRTVYLIGSHSRKRLKVEAGDADGQTSAENRERLETIGIERNRNWVIRFKFKDAGRVDTNSIERISLRDFIDQHAILGAFSGVPSKENGIDIEGLAFKGKHLYAGLRGPVLRENWVPVIRFKFDEASEAEVRYVHLGGLGIRGMETVDDGLLLLAGPVGDGPGPYRVFFWNGKDCIPDEDETEGEVHCLATLTPTSDKGKAEGITVIDQSDTSWSALVAFDGVKNTDEILGKYEIPKTPPENACD